MHFNKKTLLIFFIFNVESVDFKKNVKKPIKSLLNAKWRVKFIDSYSFEGKMQVLKKDVFNFVIPYLLFLFTPIKFFKKNGDEFNYYYLLNDNNDYFEFDFIEVKNGLVFFQKDGNRINVNVNLELFLRYQNLIEYFSKNNIFALIFASWYCTVMNEEDKKQYIGNGLIYDYIHKLFENDTSSIKNFNYLISIVKGENTKMFEEEKIKTIKEKIKEKINLIKKCLKIFAFLNTNVVLKSMPHKPIEENKDLNLNEEDEQFIDLLVEKIMNPLLEKIKLKNLIKNSNDLVCDSRAFFKENKEEVTNGMENLKKTNRLLKDLRLKLVCFYCFWSYNEIVSFNCSVGIDFAPKGYKTTVLFGCGVEFKNLYFLTNFYIDSVSLSILSYEFDFKTKDLVFNGLSFLVFPSFFSLKKFKLFGMIRLHEYISFSIGAAYVHEQQQYL